LLFGKVANDRELEPLTLQSFHYQNDPDHDDCETHHHGYQPNQQVAKHRNKKQYDADNPEQGPNYHCGQPNSDALKGMEAHKTILAIRLYKKKYDCRHKEVSQRSRQWLRQDTHTATGAFRGTHSAAAAGTEGSVIGHCCSTIWAVGGHAFFQASRAEGFLFRQFSQTP
jgi:hypothetical protein